MTQTLESWTSIRQMVSTPARRRVGRLVYRHAPELAALFYRRMLSDPELSPLLGHDLVNLRLNASMVSWLRRLFDADTAPDTLQQMQQRVGEAHARIGVSHLHVADAGRLLKRAIAERLRTDRGMTDAPAAVQYTYELVDLAIDTMTDRMSRASARLTRSDESYRLYALTQNLRAERERQRTHLVEWIQDLLVRHYWAEAETSEGESPAARSHFELWVEHKARTLFEDAPEFLALRERMRHLTQGLLPRLREQRDDPAQARAIVAAIHEAAAAMKLLLGTLFDRASTAHDGHDALTRLLNRRYLPAIVKREIGLSQANGQPFALLLLSIDHFADITVALGASAADMLLSQLADSLSEAVRASDFVFRVGDDQFALLLVDVDRDAAAEVAQVLRHLVSGLAVRASTDLAPQLTASLGVAPFEGHPDYEHLMRRAEAALAQGRREGGDRVVMASHDA